MVIYMEGEQRLSSTHPITRNDNTTYLHPLEEPSLVVRPRLAQAEEGAVGVLQSRREGQQDEEHQPRAGGGGRGKTHGGC